MSEELETVSEKLFKNGAGLRDKYYLFICEDAPNDSEGYKYTAYLVNNTDEVIPGMRRSRTSIPDNPKHREPELVLRNIPYKSYVIVGAESDNDFDYKVFYDFELRFKERIEKISFQMCRNKPETILALGLSGLLFSIGSAHKITPKPVLHLAQIPEGASPEERKEICGKMAEALYADFRTQPDNTLLLRQLSALWYAKTGVWRTHEEWNGYAQFIKDTGVTRIEQGHVDKPDLEVVFKNPGEPDLIYHIVNKPGAERVLYWSFGLFLKG